MPSDLSNDELQKLKELVREALTYHYSAMPEKGFRERLRTAFFEQLYVERTELDFLVDNAGRHELLILSGLTGTGKTTLLLKFLRHMRDGQYFVHYLNLFQHHSALRDEVYPVFWTTV